MVQGRLQREPCRHKFVDSTRCLHCGEPFNALHARLQAAVARLGVSREG
jgi:hypothetical protein